MSLALLSKESAAVGFAWIPLLFYAVRRDREPGRTPARAPILPLAISLASAALAVVVIRAIGVGFARPIVEPVPGVAASGAALSGKLFLVYLARILVPIHPTLEPPSWVIERGSALPGILGLALLAALVAGALAILAKRLGGPGLRALALGTLLGIAALLPALRIIPTSDVYGGRFLVLPVAGVAIGIGLALRVPRRPIRRGWILLAAALLALLLVGSVRRGLDWRSEERLFATEIAKNPDALRARLYWSGFLLNAGRWSEARPHVQEAARQLPDHAWVRYQQALLAMNEGRVAQAERAFSELARGPRPSPALLANWAACQMRLGRLEEGLATLDAATRDSTPTPGMRNNRANALRLLGRPEEARRELERAIADDPSYPQAQWNLVPLLLHDLADTAAALGAARRAIERFPAASETARMRALADTLARASSTQPR
jgi:tetratricopeptide (TPR) repeat protein